MHNTTPSTTSAASQPNNQIVASIVTSEDVICPACGEASGDNDLNTTTSEKDFVCRNCGFAYTSSIIERNGKRFWREVYTMPMTQDGKVIRPR